MLSKTRALRRNVLSVLVHSSLLSFVTASPASAATVTSPADSGPGSLREAINSAASGDTIGFDCAALNCPATITLTSQGNNHGFPGPTAFSISGKSLKIAAPNPGDITLQAQPGTTSATSLRLFFVDTGAALTLQNLNLTGGKAIGGNGGISQPHAGSGGGGAGLGGAIFSQGALTLQSVSLTSNGAYGGLGGGTGTPRAFGGGGGLGGDGGRGAGGGGGTGGNGGEGGSPPAAVYPQCGGFGGAGSSGLGGGGGGCYWPGQYRINGGAGSGGGGGGGGAQSNGGPGSEGGGGGGSAVIGGTAGAGGFGGGGGGAYCLYINPHDYGQGGNGGFGGGGGGCVNGIAGIGGVGGGAGQSIYTFSGSPGGGGTGFGGAVFARSGSVVVQRPYFGGKLTGNSVTAGTGYRSGAAAGSGLFLMSGVTNTFEIAGVYTIDDTIADDSPVGVPPGQSFTPGAGLGVFLNKTGPGILVLNGANAFAGLTAVFAGAVGGNGQVPSSFFVDSGGAIHPGDPTVRHDVGTLTTGALNWAAGGTMFMQIGSNQAGSDLLVVNGPLTKNGSGTWYVNFSVGDNPPKPGAKYTLIQSTDASAFTAADFTATFDSSFNSLSGAFSIEGNAVKFTVDTVSTGLIFRNGFD